MASILIVTDSYPPEIRSSAHLMQELAEGFSGRGYKVFVVTAYPSHNLAGGHEEPPEVSEERGIKVIRVKILPHHNVNFVVKGVVQLMMPHLFAKKAAGIVGGKVDFVIVHSPPLPLAGTAKRIKRRYGARFVLNVHDFFPQNAVDLGVLKDPFSVSFFRRMEQAAYRSADVIVVPSSKHKSFLCDKRGVPAEKIHVIPHWIDTEPFRNVQPTGRFRNKFGLRGKFIFLFAGNFGPSQALDMIIRAAREVQDIGDVRFLFVGDGSEKAKLVRMADEYRLRNVRFVPLVPKGEYPGLLKDVDVGLVTLTAKNTTPAVPAKLMGYMAAGLPVAAFLHKESEGIDIVREAGCGYAALSEDEAEIVRVIRRMYAERELLKAQGENGFKYLLAHFDRNVCLNRWEALLKA